MAGRQTPVMQQHAAAKQAYPDAIVFFRLGDFYEMFGEDAVVASKLLELTLTSRNKGKSDEVPMAGVPHHAAHAYIGRLLEKGHKVAICEQMADPSKVKGIVPREVVRVLTPAMVTEREQLDASTNNWLFAIELGSLAEGFGKNFDVQRSAATQRTRASVGIALLDLSTGELRAANPSDLTLLLAELAHAAPREVIVGAAEGSEAGRERAVSALQKVLPAKAIREDRALADEELPACLGELAQEAAALSPEARRAVARALRFARDCNPGIALPMQRIGRWEPSETLIVDPTAQAHLELVDSVSGQKAATLLGVLGQTKTPPGARLLRRRLLAPLKDVERIRRRLDMVEGFVMHPRLRGELAQALSDLGDLERLAVRASLGQATPRDLGAIRDGLHAARRAVDVLQTIEDLSLREVLCLNEPIDCVEELAAELTRALVERPPALAKDGGIFLEGYHPELDELGQLRKTGSERVVQFEAELREQTGIANLKVRYTRVFGWYIELSKSQAGRAPESWHRKQTVASGERFTTPELDELADRLATAEERHRELELELLRRLVQQAGAASGRLRALSALLARWDVAQALAEVAHRYDYSRPVVDDSDQLLIRDGRHPVVERLAAAGGFVPNDVSLDLGNERLWLITGPNMAGKSTLLRQTALTVIMAQMGSYVPARSARIGVVDRVLSRVGASDNLAQGESTFMVEMRETAEILRSATSRSLVILDEIGRGTSTFDGLAIARAVAEYLDEAVRCRALFATHYHELTELAEESRHIANYSVSARELGDDIVFLHRLVPGAASRSYGVAVAKLAGLPESVLARARALLNVLEAGQSAEPQPPRKAKSRERSGQNQLDLFNAPSVSKADQEVLGTLKELEPDRLTGLEALQLISQLQKRLKG